MFLYDSNSVKQLLILVIDQYVLVKWLGDKPDKVRKYYLNEINVTMSISVG